MPIKAPKGFIDESDPRVCLIGHPAPPWLVNYADLMTELVCFFIILYALSAALNKDVQNARQQVQEMIKNKEVSGNVTIDKDGLHITLEEQGKNVFFQSGSAELTPEMESMMDKLSPVLKKLVNEHEISVEGHTDAQNIRNDLYQNNWELSTARATNVVEYLIRSKDFPPEKMSAAGFGQFRPVVPNDTPEHRSKNRRVVFFVKNSVKPLALKTPPGAPGAKEARPAPAGEPAAPANLEGPAKKGGWRSYISSISMPKFSFSRLLPKWLTKWFNR